MRAPLRLGVPVASDQRLWQPDLTQHRVDAIAQSLPDQAWRRLSAGFGSKGERLYDWALMRFSEQDGWARALLVRRSIDRNPSVRNLPSWASGRIDKAETGKRTGRK